MMKRKFRRLCNRHRWIPVAITILFIALWLLLLWKVGALAELERDEMISFYIAAGVMLLCSLVAGSACSSYLMNPTVKSLNNQCDPFPLLAECEDQFTYVKNKGNRQLLTINHAAALIELGRNEEALAELEALNIDAPAAMPVWRYVYYHNAAIASFNCGQREKADAYRNKANQQVPSVKSKKLQPMIRSTARQLEAIHYLEDGDYTNARQILGQCIDLPDTLAKVHHAFLWGQLELAQGNPAAARVPLEFAAQYGNRLAVAETARALLNDM